mgnify:CR=1 FL=1
MSVQISFVYILGYFLKSILVDFLQTLNFLFLFLILLVKTKKSMFVALFVLVGKTCMKLHDADFTSDIASYGSKSQLPKMDIGCFGKC